ncbi:MAG: DNA mismatch repair protein MutS [Bacteroidota bacterium]|nr:DNA mismatch repair protein MutS [Bacteroidota bacterium]
MVQYNSIKSKHPEALLLFRVGDFYETFGQDAIKASEILGIVLTNRANGSSNIELAGFPYHSLDTYLPKLVRSGERVAICEQLEDPKLTKKIVKRGVSELVTPGVSYNDLTLTSNKNNFLASIYYGRDSIGISFLDISTGEFLIDQGNKDYINKLLYDLEPKEVLFEKNNQIIFNQDFDFLSCIFGLDEWVFTKDYTRDLLLRKFKTNSLKGFGVEELHNGTIAAGVILHYLNETNHNKTDHILSVSRIGLEKYVWMDRFTVRNLEIFHSFNRDAKTLIDILDSTSSPMGSRLLRRWLALPLKDKKVLQSRIDIVEGFKDNTEFAKIIRTEIINIGDLERLISKVSTGRISPRECKKLGEALQSLPEIKKYCKNSVLPPIKRLSRKIILCQKIEKKINSQLLSNPPVLSNKGNIINDGLNKELDKLRNLRSTGKEYLDEILKREIEHTGISSLKIAFNNVFGYYLEVRNTHKEKVPEEWIRKQTLVNAERYITEELKEYETKILTAEEKIFELELSIYQNLVLEISKYVNKIQNNAHIIAQLDCFLSFASIANKYNYCKPQLEEDSVLEIKQGRHPVIEKQLSNEEHYIPNDVYLDNKTQQIMMITGPNMSGKSALLRQTALIVLMAQIGSFVPARVAKIGLVDKIFTRVGASDNISMGESTFMVEMNETASILNNISKNSLIILDEIGRGTSTYDGISIAWAIAEYLHNSDSKPKTLFATHYHELNQMENSFDRIKNYNVSVKETNQDIIFLRKLQKGGSNHSFGIHVAKMAGMPRLLIERSKIMLNQLEKSRSKKTINNQKGDMQLSFFKLDDPVLEQVRDELVNIDINSLTPVEAKLKLNEIKKLIGN